MNSIAEEITGWSEKQATGSNIEEILQLFDEKTSKSFDFPELFNDTQPTLQKTFKEMLLKNKGGGTILIEGSISVIQDRMGTIEGYVIAFRDISEKRALSETINYQANHDSLTGLINRNAFSMKLSTFIESAQQEECQHALLYLDLDQFNLINDSVGQSAGDDLLLETTAIIKSVIRGSDVCARIGGDEFGIILGYSTPEQAKVVSQRLHAKLADKKLSWGSQVFNIHSSIGLVMIEGDKLEMQTILSAASDACTLAKDEGGRRIKYYTISDSLFQQRQGEMQWVSRLMKVLEEDRFRLYVQPIVPLKPISEYHNKYEILIRMLDDQGQVVSPARFIPAAEKYHFMPQLDRWVIANTLDMCGTLQIEGLFSINLSAQSVAEVNFLEYIYRQFDKHKVDPKTICFEITETATISNMATASSFIEDLKKIGCTFALDDFGSGFSSFNYLKNMPIDFLKIDGSFVRDMDKNPVNSAMVEAMNTLGHIIGVKTIAEFVCNSTIKEKLTDLNVDFAQGFELSEPKPITQLLN
jgi:diguanylate cyclase (GGDEF)-like protein/PAS domain S-box-containing protein